MNKFLYLKGKDNGMVAISVECIIGMEEVYNGITQKFSYTTVRVQDAEYITKETIEEIKEKLIMLED